MCGRCLCWCFLILTWVPLSVAGSLSVECPRYVLENDDLTCRCHATSGTVTWPGHSHNGTLIVPNVQRAQNGTQYTCRLEGGGGEGESVNYTLLVAYGPSEEAHSITADQPCPFPTNGSQGLVLTCHVGQVYPPPDFVWREVKCADTQLSNTCVVKPQPPGDDGKVVQCAVSRKYETGLPQTYMTTVYKIQLTYPPLSAPYIQIQAKDPHLLRKGDNLTCSIKGGKPAVSKVVFSCSTPHHADAMDEGEEGGVVRSRVTVSSLSQWRQPMHCGCHGVWSVGPEYYRLTAEGFYLVEHPATVTNFTIDGSRDDVTTVTGNTGTSVDFLCFTYGRPIATEAHFSKANSAAFNGSDDQTTRTVLGNWTTQLRVRMEGVRCEDMGRYLCSADNGVGEGQTASLKLQVQCGPRRLSDRMLELQEGRIQFSLLAFPVPDRFLFYRLHGTQSLPGNASLLDSSRFKAECVQDAVLLYQVDCVITPLVISTGQMGQYRATVGNALGSVDVFFINTTVIPGGGDGGLSRKEITGVVIGILGIIIIVVVIIVVVIKCLQRRRSKVARGNAGGVTSPPGHELGLQPQRTTTDQADSGSRVGSANMKVMNDSASSNANDGANLYPSVSGDTAETNVNASEDSTYANTSAGNANTNANANANIPRGTVNTNICDGGNLPSGMMDSNGYGYSTVNKATMQKGRGDREGERGGGGKEEEEGEGGGGGGGEEEGGRGLEDDYAVPDVPSDGHGDTGRSVDSQGDGQQDPPETAVQSTDEINKSLSTGQGSASTARDGAAEENPYDKINREGTRPKNGAVDNTYDHVPFLHQHD